MPIYCKRCSHVLRRVPGVHSPGEPYPQRDAAGAYIACPTCALKHREHDDGERRGDVDERPNR